MFGKYLSADSAELAEKLGPPADLRRVVPLMLSPEQRPAFDPGRPTWGPAEGAGPEAGLRLTGGGLGPVIDPGVLPLRPGQPLCDFFMKTGGEGGCCLGHVWVLTLVGGRRNRGVWTSCSAGAGRGTLIWEGKSKRPHLARKLLLCEPTVSVRALDPSRLRCRILQVWRHLSV